MKVRLYTYFCSISLNELGQTFFNIHDLPFSRTPSIKKIGVKVGSETIFSDLWGPAPTEVQFSIIWLYLYVSNQGTNKTVAAIFFF